MKQSRKKMLNVTCSEGIRKRVDDFLNTQYQTWRNIQQPKQSNNGIFTCGDANNNTLLMDYIRFIYSQYNISDPLINMQKQQQYQHTPNKDIPTVTKIKITNNNILSNHQKTIKKIENQQQLSNFKQSRIMEQTPAKQLNQKFSQSIIRKTLFQSGQSTYHQRIGSNFKQRVTIDSCNKSDTIRDDGNFYDQSRHRARHSENFQQISSVQIVKESVNNGTKIYTPKQSKAQQDETPIFKFSKKINSMSQKKQQKPISEVYRYCIACEHAVLEANIQRHEISCSEFAKVYQLDLDGILEHLNLKIDHLKNKLQKYSSSLREGDCQQLKQICQTMQKQCDNAIKLGKTSNKYLKNYEQAIQIGRRWTLTTEQINKLRWFIKIRQQIKIHFNI